MAEAVRFRLTRGEWERRRSLDVRVAGFDQCPAVRSLGTNHSAPQDYCAASTDASSARTARSIVLVASTSVYNGRCSPAPRTITTVGWTGQGCQKKPFALPIGVIFATR
jgi:hypothetical protein